MAGWGTCRHCRKSVWWGESRIDPERVWPFDDADETAVHFDSCEAQDRVTDDSGAVHRVNACKDCGARVWWQTTVRGRRRPMDCTGQKATRTCHFDTCTARTTHKEEPRHERQHRAEPAHNYNDPLHMWLADLDLAMPVTLAEVTSKFRRLAQQTHPDHGGSSAAFIRVKLAYDRVRQLLPQEVRT